MKTIQQGLDESYKKAGQNAYFGNGFTAGVEFTQRWIPVEEELPEMLTNDLSAWVLVRNHYGRYEIMKYDYKYNIEITYCKSYEILNLR
jgi:hypothetical protein